MSVALSPKDVRSIAIVHSVRPAPPPTWRLKHGGDPAVCDCHHTDGAHWLHLREGLSVIESVAVEEDGRVWHHASVARRNRMPSYDDIALVRRQFIGDREAYMVLPPSHRHVNIHSYALHLFACLDVPDGQVLPRFERGGTSL